MSKYWKDGHWRTSINCDTHWVSGHWVYRDNWDRQGYSQGRTIHSNETIYSFENRQFDEFTKPTICPRCGAEVYFVRHNGGCVWLDSLGKPWPKHPCFDDPDEIVFSTTKKELEKTRIDYFGIVVEITPHNQPTHYKFRIQCSNTELIEGVFNYQGNAEDWLGQIVIIERVFKNITIDNIFLGKLSGKLITSNNVQSVQR